MKRWEYSKPWKFTALLLNQICAVVLVLSVVMGAVIMAAGWLLWKLTVWMIRSMALGHKKLAR